jgi:hypothetical protein
VINAVFSKLIVPSEIPSFSSQSAIATQPLGHLTLSWTGVYRARRGPAVGLRVRSKSSASIWLCRLLGSEDLANDLNAERGPDAIELDYARRSFNWSVAQSGSNLSMRLTHLVTWKVQLRRRFMRAGLDTEAKLWFNPSMRAC